MLNKILSSNKAFFCIFLTIVLMCSSLVYANEKAKRAYKEAATLLKNKQFFQGVKAYYQFLLAHDPLVSLEVRKSELRSAKEFLVQTAKSSPGNLKALLFLSITYRVVEVMKPSNSILEKLIKLKPNSALLFFLKGEYSLWQDSTKEGTEFFLKLKKHPKGKNLWEVAKAVQKRYGVDLAGEELKTELLRRAYRELDLLEREKAEELFKKIQADFPDEFEATRALLEMYVEVDRLDDADRELKNLKLKSLSPAIPFLEIRLRLKQKKFEEVVKVGNGILRKDPQNDYIKGILAEGMYQTRMFEEAMPYYKELADFSPENIGFVLRYTECLEGSRKIAEAIEFLKERIDRRPKCEDLLRLELGGIYERAGIVFFAKDQYEIVATRSGKLKAQGLENFERCAAILSGRAEKNSGTEELDADGNPIPPPPPTPTPTPTPEDTSKKPPPPLPPEAYLSKKEPDLPPPPPKPQKPKKSLMSRLSTIYE